MSGTSPGRIVFGLASVLAGVVGLVWRASLIWAPLHALGAPLAQAAAWCIAAAQVAGGLALLDRRTARFGAPVLGAVCVLFTLQSVPAILASPGTYVNYIDFFERLSIVCGLLALYAPRAARIGMGICAVSFALAQVAYLQYTASLVPAWIPPGQVFWTNATTAAFALAAAGLLANRYARSAAGWMALMLVLFGVLVWVPRIVAHPHMLGNWSEIAENYLIAGAALLVAERIASRAIGQITRTTPITPRSS